MRKKLYVIVVMLTLMATGCVREQVEININAKCAIIEERENGLVLFEKNADLRFPPASTAKVMTAVVAIENKDLDADIIISRDAVMTEPTVAGLNLGVRYKLGDLIPAILVKSANDAAVAIAENISGSETAFAILMNSKAKELRMDNTYFVTASGLPTGKKDEQYTTARDLAILMRYAARYKVILDAMSRKEMTIYGSDKKVIKLKTHNRALFKSDSAPWGKTGYTKEAKRTFIGVDPSASPKIVFSVLQSNTLWKDITTLNENGIMMYGQNHQNILSSLVTWIKSQRQRTWKEISTVIA
ncbi:MAG: D-alanyl-D-alanine carboxypeptidase [Candidatus Omnitrophica bacterium]|nr:D-alanyl-D-alanine carboxypeptidase [Candidatus Omnitrophota bacterium]